MADETKLEFDDTALGYVDVVIGTVRVMVIADDGEIYKADGVVVAVPEQYTYSDDDRMDAAQSQSQLFVRYVDPLTGAFEVHQPGNTPGIFTMAKAREYARDLFGVGEWSDDAADCLVERPAVYQRRGGHGQ